MATYSPELTADIIRRVAEGDSLRKIQSDTGVPMGSMLRWVAKPEHVEQYTIARESAADIYEADIYEAAIATTPENAAADRVKIDALKWKAARLAPKKYGDKSTQEVTGKDGAPIEHAVNIAVTFHDPER